MHLKLWIGQKKGDIKRILLNLKKTHSMKKIHIILSIILIILISVTLFVYKPWNRQQTQLKIAISKAKPADSYGAYADWVHAADSNIVIVDMYDFSIDSALMFLEECSGLLLSGGQDIYPGIYGKEVDTSRCGPFDLKRDSLELALIEKAMALDIPILGICRGHQMLNVALGGSLIIDIPTDYDTTIKHRIPETYNCFHQINVEAGTRLYWATDLINGDVNSRHHQAIDQLSDKLKVTAKSNDGIVEAVEWKDAGTRAFLMGVQWHPEQMELNNPFSKSILEYFIFEVKTFSEKLD